MNLVYLHVRRHALFPMRIFPTLCLLLLSFSLSAQRISNLRLFAVSDKSITIKFTITPGPTCYGYNIYHSTDSINFFEIYNYPQQCGGSGAPEDQSFTHANPVPNAANFYKVQLNPYETSPVVRIFLGSNTLSGMIPFPNPVYSYDQKLNLRLFNTNGVKLQGFLLDQFGNEKQYLDLVSESDMVSIGVSGLRNGFYVVWLTDGYNLFRAKFIVNR
jgi:hypothetical protein